MAFVRFSRDRRGYEHVYLVDSSAERGGRTRVLYWFRTPPGVKVGRSPFDSETQRDLERRNPGVQFDWPQIVAAKIAPPVPVENWREKRRSERAMKRVRAAEAAETAEFERVADQGSAVSDELADVGEPVDVLPDEPTDPEDEEPEPWSARGAEDLATDATTATEDGPIPEPVQTESGAVPRRSRRRRRRRGRRPTEGPAQGPPAADQNGRLDPAEPGQEPSDEH